MADNDNDNPDVVVGTGGASPQWLADIVVSALDEAAVEFDVRATGRLSAEGRTITATLNSSGVSAIQLENARRFRNGNQPDQMAKMIDVLAEIGRRIPSTT